MKRIFFLLVVLLCYQKTKAQCDYEVYSSQITPQSAVQSILGQGISVSNISFSGNPSQLGSYNTHHYLFINSCGTENGIVLATGKVGNLNDSNSPAQNWLFTGEDQNGGTNNYTDSDLQILNAGNGLIMSVAILEFDFIPTSNQVEFNFRFASEEYFDYVNAGKNDAFGFFISGPGITGPYSNNSTNIALVPSTTIPISVNTVNNVQNSNYLITNPSQSPLFAFNAFTRKLTAKANVQCGQTYHIKLAIGDGGDIFLDSGVFLEAGSLNSNFFISDIVAIPSVVCEGQPVDLSVTGDAGWTYDWSDGQSGIGLRDITVIPPVGNTTYTVTATHPNGCSVTESVNVIVHPNNNIPPFVNGINNTGDYTYFANDGDFISFNIPSFDNPNEAVVITPLSMISGASFNSSGSPHQTGTFEWQTLPGSYGVYTFTIRVCDQNLCGTLCSDYTFTVIITCPQCPLDVYYENRSIATTPLPVLTKAPRKIVAGYSVDPSQTDGDVIVGVGESVIFEAGVLIDISQGGFYVNGGTFIAQIVPNTCIDECDNCCQEWTHFSYDFIPNVFTPNADGVNDVWYIPDSQNPNCAYNANGYELSIYNRWGYRISYESRYENYCCPFNSGQIKWNGLANQSTNCTFLEQLFGCNDMNYGDHAPDGTYYYILKFIINIGNGACYHEEFRIGEITLLGSSQSQMSEVILENQNGNELTYPDGTTLILNVNSKIENKAYISIFPNPTINQFSIQISDELISENTTVEIFDSQGKLVHLDQLQGNEKLINFNSYNNGIYLVKVSGNGHSIVKRLIKN